MQKYKIRIGSLRANKKKETDHFSNPKVSQIMNGFATFILILILQKGWDGISYSGINVIDKPTAQILRRGDPNLPL